MLSIFGTVQIRGTMKLRHTSFQFEHLWPIADRIAGKLFTICSEKVGAGTEREIRPGRGDPISGILSGIDLVLTDPIRHNIPRWSDYPFSDQIEREAAIELAMSKANCCNVELRDLYSLLLL